MPVSPTIIGRSPTSVTAHGIPQAIASAMALEKPSPNREQQVATVSAL